MYFISINNCPVFSWFQGSGSGLFYDFEPKRKIPCIFVLDVWWRPAVSIAFVSAKSLLFLSVENDGMIQHEGCTQDETGRSEEGIAPRVGFFAEPRYMLSGGLSFFWEMGWKTRITFKKKSDGQKSRGLFRSMLSCLNARMRQIRCFI